MTEKESRKLKPGDRVCLSGYDTGTKKGFQVDGTVTETGFNAVKMHWDDGQCGIIDHRGMENVSKAEVLA